jgi:hypothetical protein
MTTTPRESFSLEIDLLKRYWPWGALLAVGASLCLYAEYYNRGQHETFVREAVPADAVVEEYLGSEPFRYGRHGSYQARHRYILRFDGHRGFAYSMKEYPVGQKLKVFYVPNDTRGYHVSRENLRLVEDEVK